MSVLMTAGKKALQKSQKQHQQQHHKKKNSKQNVSSQNTTSVGGSGSLMPAPPPMSSPSMSVWYWTLDGLATTVIFNKANNEVWCNGSIMQTCEGFAETEDEVGFDCGIIDFVIFSAHTQTSHAGRIKRLPLLARSRSSSLSASTNSLELGSHCLTVDNCFIPEYTDQPVSSSDHGEDYDFDDGDDYDGPIYPQSPPNYNPAAYNNGRRLI